MTFRTRVRFPPPPPINRSRPPSGRLLCSHLHSHDVPRRTTLRTGLHMKIHTLGFAKKSASESFTLLRDSGASRTVDIRLHNSSHLAGYTKSADPAYFPRAHSAMVITHATGA